jgi:hypothetical protein
MTYPFFVSPYPDTASDAPILGAVERSILGAMVRKRGHTLTAMELTANVSTPTPTPRRMSDYIERIRAVVGRDAIVDVPRRGWQYIGA